MVQEVTSIEEDIKKSKNLKIEIIVASESNGVIGEDGTIPWRCSGDMKHFRQKTLNHPIIMGRKTYESIGKALPKRKNIVLTNSDISTFPADQELHLARSLADALYYCPDNSTVMICGGGEVYKQFLPLADAVYHSEIDITIEDSKGLPSFPDLSLDKAWKPITRESFPGDGPRSIGWDLVIYKRVS